MTIYTYSDVDIFLTKQADGDIKKDVNVEAIINSLTNIINTRKGSRRMLPDFASDFYRLLFEPVDEITAKEIGYSLFDSINKWEDRIMVENIHVTARQREKAYNCTLTFKVKEDSIVRSIDFILIRN